MPLSGPFASQPEALSVESTEIRFPGHHTLAELYGCIEQLDRGIAVGWTSFDHIVPDRARSVVEENPLKTMVKSDGPIAPIQGRLRQHLTGQVQPARF